MNSIALRCYCRSWRSSRRGDTWKNLRIVITVEMATIVVDTPRSSYNCRIADLQTSFLFSAWHNHVLGTAENVYVDPLRVCASVRRNSGPSSGSQPAGLRESARVRSGFRARRFSILLPKAKLKLDFVTCVVILKKTYFMLSFFVSI